jgi:2,3-diaminopropionate biosynthesis protein SbnB
MTNEGILFLTGPEVARLLAGQEMAVVEEVRQAYLIHGNGESFLPHSTFLRFPDNPRNRIIALPSYLGGRFGVAGIKWIASFPGNHELGLPRASAVIVLNSISTGRPVAIIEGSVISARRTAASAALAASVLQSQPARRVGIIGCGLINLEIARFLLAVQPEIESFVVYDIDEAKTRQFADSCQQEFPGTRVERGRELQTTLTSSSLISFATTALKPHVSDLRACVPGTTILHISLRDLTGEAILESDNVVDDVDHVCRAETSVHLAEQLAGDRVFIRCTLAEVLSCAAKPRRSAEGVTVFSPFGLGALDLAVSQLAYTLARQQHLGTTIEAFFPET